MELVQEGRLGGDNPSEQTGHGSDDPLERLAAETPEVDEQPEGEAGAPAAPPEERAEPEPDPEPDGAKSQVRTYVVLEEQEFEDGQKYTVELGRFEARNATNALRRAFKQLITDNESHTLIAITATQWRPTPVQRSHRQVESVQIGG